MIIRRFPEISSINILTLGGKTEEERLERIKNEMIIRRIRETRNKAFKFLAKWLAPVGGRVVGLFKNWLQRIKDTEKRYKDAIKSLPKEEIVAKIKGLITEAENLVKNARFELAEKYYLEALSLDFKNIDVYYGLAWLYIEKKQYKEARESLEFILKLNPNFSEAYYGLAEIAKREERINEAIEFSRRAVELSSNNPKYLDFLIEMCIIGKRAELAKSALEQFKMVNPENNKIAEFEARIGEARKNGKES